MNQRITILLLNYRRPENLPVILNSIEQQTIKSRIFLWDNSEHPIEDNRIDWQLSSSKNRYCWPRWFMARYAETEYVMTLDDDLHLAHPQTLEFLIKEAEMFPAPGRVIGITGVQINDMNYYPTPEQKLNGEGTLHIQYAKERQFADIIKGRLMFCKTEEVKKIPLEIKYKDVGDDIAMSALLANGKPRHHIIMKNDQELVANLPGGSGDMAQCKRPNWGTMRTEVMRHYFPVKTRSFSKVHLI